MPSRHRVKTYVENGYYHVYNRGVAKLPIFLDKQDYGVFLKYLRESLNKPVEKITIRYVQGRSFTAIQKQPKNFNTEILLVSYCLMPNHFHFLLKQNSKRSVESFMRSLMTRYAQYFNKRNDRVGPVFQGRYKCVMVSDDRYLLHLSRYIHLNPTEIVDEILDGYSSYSEYLGLRKTEWVKPDIILNFFKGTTFPEFKKINDYKTFVENYTGNSEDVLRELTLE